MSTNWIEGTLLPRFAARCEGWRIKESHGGPLPDDWDTTEFFLGLQVGYVKGDVESDKRYPLGSTMVELLCADLGGRRQLDQYVLDWLIGHWGDPRIPTWFKDAMESARLWIVVAGAILTDQAGHEYFMLFYWVNGRPEWHCELLSANYCCFFYQGLVRAES